MRCDGSNQVVLCISIEHLLSNSGQDLSIFFLGNTGFDAAAKTPFFVMLEKIFLFNVIKYWHYS